MSNKAIWDRLKSPPQSALKPILAGRLKGKSDINPQWRYEVMTEVFGVCGIGWKYAIDKLWLESAPEGQMFAFAQISLSVKNDNAWSEPITGIGGSMLIQKEKGGLYANDEGFKMAVTDALGTAMKMIGVAADVYAGKWDGSKYIKEEPESPRAQAVKTATGDYLHSKEKLTSSQQEIYRKGLDSWAQMNEIHPDIVDRKEFKKAVIEALGRNAESDKEMESALLKMMSNNKKLAEATK
jgi:hypothetical protein